MKHLIISFLAIMLPVMASATPISEETAKANVLQFINNSGKRKAMGDHRLSLVHAITQEGAVDDASPLLYIFNVNGDEGFVVASADDVALPILGYGWEGGFPADGIPDNTMAWLQGYADQIASAKASGLPSPTKSEVRAMAQNRAKMKKESVDYMVKVNWGQESPYNDMCIFDGNVCATGCVATAMAQVMYYWGVTGRDGIRFRHGCEALDAYQTNYKKYDVPALDSLESFGWDAMDEGTEAPEKKEAMWAVAQLMRYCGQSVKMNYSWTSSASSSKIISGLRHFGYSEDMQFANASFFLKTYGEFPSFDLWDEYLYNEMRMKRPVVMCITIPAIQHCFVCDGYDASNNSFHLNWGWAGGRNGYFVLRAVYAKYNAMPGSYVAVTGIEPQLSSYGVLSTDGSTLTLFRDNMKDHHEGTVYEMNATDFEGWDAMMDSATINGVHRFAVDSSFLYGKISGNYLKGFHNVDEINGLENLNSCNATTLRCMFEGCENLHDLDLGHFNTSTVSDMEYMLHGCSNLKELDLSNFTIKEGCLTGAMLYGCTSLEKLIVSSSMEDIYEANSENNQPADSCGIDACEGVGTPQKPCIIEAPCSFDFHTDTSDTFKWKGGYFRLLKRMGDVNHDNQLTISDVALVIGHINGTTPDNDLDLTLADVDYDGETSVTDAVIIIKAILGDK